MKPLRSSSKLWKNFVVLWGVSVLSGCASIYKGDTCLSNPPAGAAACLNTETGKRRLVPLSETMNWLMIPQEDTAALLRACRLSKSEVKLISQALNWGYDENARIAKELGE